jgi:hypothetical protein
MSLEENEEKGIRDEIDRLEQEVNEIAIANKLKSKTGINMIDVLQANCKNIIMVDEAVKLINDAIISQQSRIMRMDDDIKKMRAVNTLLSISLFVTSIILAFHIFK